VTLALLALAGGSARLAAQQSDDLQSDDLKSDDQPYSNPVQPLNAGQIEQLVAPIALYPDALVAQILAASTYPQQVAEADQWRQSQNYSSPEAIPDAAGRQNWDPSVMALTAFPSVLAQMDRNMQWTSDLGNAYYNQPQDVLEAVQVMRRRAQEAGNLQSSPQQVVRHQRGYIELAPANPEVVYVPAYNPWTVYGEPLSPYPGFSLLDVVGEFFGSSALRYGAGIAMSAFSNSPFGWLAWGLNWLTQAVLFNHSDYYSHSNTVADWGFGHRGFHAYAGRGGFGGSRFRNAGFRGGENWRHAGYGGNGWHSFGRNSGARDWSHLENRGAHSSHGFESFRNPRNSSAGFGSNSRSNFRDGRSTYASNFHRSPSAGFPRNGGSERDRGFQGQPFGSRSTASFAGSTFRGSFASHNFGSSGRPARSSGFHFSNGGRSQRSSSSRGGGGFHFGGGGHAPKSFSGGKSFGGGRSHGGGHSGGHGGSKHHR
jgi:hypothetical protein